MEATSKLIIFMTVICVVYCTNTDSHYPLKARSRFFEFLFNSCNCKCGLPNRQARPSAGEYLLNYEFPWLALIQIKGTTVSGTLITNKHVLTTASILVGLTPYDVKVTLGQPDRCVPDISSLNVSVESIITHREFNSGSKVNDIALIKLSSPVIFDKRISPVCLSTPGSFYVGQVATFVGWPATTPDKIATNCRARKVGLPVLERKDCYKSVHYPEFVTDDKRCAGIIGATSVICKSDEGSPVMYRSYGGVYELIGIVNDKNECNDKPSVALYTIINDHMSWITDNTRGACYCLKTN